MYISHLSQYSWLTRPAWGSRRYPGLWSADSRCQSRPRIDHRSARPRGTFAQRPNSTRRRKFQKVLSVEHWVMNLYRVKSIPPAPFVFKFGDHQSPYRQYWELKCRRFRVGGFFWLYIDSFLYSWILLQYISSGIPMERWRNYTLLYILMFGKWTTFRLQMFISFSDNFLLFTSGKKQFSPIFEKIKTQKYRFSWSSNLLDFLQYLASFQS